VIRGRWSSECPLDDPLDDLSVDSADGALVRRLVLGFRIVGGGRQL
jgi:hypothetical protein